MIDVRDVSVLRPGATRPILDQVSFTLADGERAALLGGNGSGKTTLVRLLNGTLLPSSGSVRVDDDATHDKVALERVRRRVGLLFQEPDNQFVTTTVEREVAFGLENLAVPTADMRRDVDRMLREFDLERHRQSPPHEMSGGEKARLALACVWVMGPGAIVLDETESLLDRRGAEQLWKQIGRLPRDTSVLRVTTDPEVAATSARVLVLHEGRLIADGAPDDVLRALPDAVVERVGHPLIWQISAQLVQDGLIDSPTASWATLLRKLGASGSTAGGTA